MDYYKTMSDFGSTPSILGFFQSIASAVPIFFPFVIFMFWLVGSAASYFIILKTTGRKRFFHTTTAMSFVMFIASLGLASMNTASITIMSGYWVGFYLLATLLSFYGLSQYK